MDDNAPSMIARRLTHEQACAERRLYWSRKSVAERLAAATALTERLYKMRGIDVHERKADFSSRFVSRRQR